MFFATPAWDLALLRAVNTGLACPVLDPAMRAASSPLCLWLLGAAAALAALETGDVDAALVDSISAYLFIAQGRNLTMLPDPVLDESYAAVTSKKSRQLRAAIDATILDLKADGYLDALRDKWLLQRVP